MNLSGINFGMQPFANQYPIMQNQNMINPLPVEIRYSGATNVIPYLSIPVKNTECSYGYYIPYPNPYIASFRPNATLTTQLDQQQYNTRMQTFSPNNLNTVAAMNNYYDSYSQTNQNPQQIRLSQNNNLESSKQNITQNKNSQTSNIEQIPSGQKQQ